MRYLLDSNVLIQVLRARPALAGLTGRVRALSREEGLICSVVREELLFGAARSREPARQLEVVRAFLAPMVSLPFDDVAADRAFAIRADLAAKGTPIGPHDIQIAAIALAHGLTLVTHNTTDFGRVSGLTCEDWERSP